MRSVNHTARTTVALLVGLIAISASLSCSRLAAQDTDRKDVLVLYGLQSHMPIVTDWDRSIREAIQSSLDEPVRIEVEFLDLLRSQDAEYRDEWIALLRRKYEDNDPDVVIAVFDPALQFALDHRDALFPDVPVVFCSAHFFRVNGTQLPSDFTGVTYDLSYEKTLDVARGLRRQTRKVTVVTGSSDFAQAMLTEARGILKDDPEYEFSFLTGLSVEETISEVARLPEDSIVLFIVYVRDPQGRSFHANDVLSRMSANASVPIFSLWDTNLGTGAVGGDVVRVKEQGKMASEIAARILQGEAASSIPIIGQDSNEVVIDWRQLRRWDMDEHRLPADSVILHRTESLWQSYGNYILIAAGVIFLQLALILGLLVNRTMRRRAERSLTRSREEARTLTGRLITAQEDERKRLAREMHDDLSQRLAAKANDAGRLADEPEVSATAVTIKDELVTLAEDVHRISRQLHPSILDDLGLEDALRSECEAFSEREATKVEFQTRDVPRSIPNEVALCVYRVAQEALRNCTKHAGTDRIDVGLIADDEFLNLTVQDNGRGFEPAEIVGKPGLGLASIRERVRLVRGDLSVSSEPGGGTLIEICVPYTEA